MSAIGPVKMLIVNAMRGGLIANVDGEPCKSYEEADQASFARPDHRFQWTRPDESAFPDFNRKGAFGLYFTPTVQEFIRYIDTVTQHTALL